MAILFDKKRGVFIQAQSARQEMTFVDDSGAHVTIPMGGSAPIVHEGRHLRIHFTERGIHVEEISGDELRHLQKEQQLKETAAAVAKVMGW